MASALVTPLGSACGRPTHYSAGLHSVWRLQKLAPSRPFGPRGSGPETAVEEAVAAAAAAPGAQPRSSVRTAAAAAATPAAAGCKACCGGGAATAAKSASAAVLGVPAGALFSGSTVLMVPVYALMAFFPSAKLTRGLLLNSSGLYIGLAAVYAAALAGAWQAGLGAALAGVVASLRSAALAHTAWAALDLSPLANMFVQPLVTLLCWLHLLALDALMAREIALDGLRTRTPTAHSVLLCFFFGPTGLLSHAITRLLLRGRTSS